MTIFEDEVCTVIMFVEVDFVRVIGRCALLILVNICWGIRGLNIICHFRSCAVISVGNFDHDNRTVCDFVEFARIIKIMF